MKLYFAYILHLFGFIFYLFRASSVLLPFYYISYLFWISYLACLTLGIIYFMSYIFHVSRLKTFFDSQIFFQPQATSQNLSYLTRDKRLINTTLYIMQILIWVDINSNYTKMRSFFNDFEKYIYDFFNCQ